MNSFLFLLLVGIKFHYSENVMAGVQLNITFSLSYMEILDKLNQSSPHPLQNYNYLRLVDK